MNQNKQEESLSRQQRKLFGRRPIVIPAISQDRKYIIPEDIVACIDVNEDITKLRRDYLMIMGGGHGWGIEDETLCAFVLTEKEK